MNQQFQARMRQADIAFQEALHAHQKGSLDKAIRGYERVLKLTPRDADALYLLGTAHSQAGRHAQALPLLEKALERRPHHPETLNNIGLTLKGLRREKEALEFYRRALELQPDYADAHNNMGNVLEHMGRLDEAEPYLRRALELQPSHADAHCNLGLVLMRKDHFSEAAASLQRGLALRPNHAISYDFLGSIYKIWGRFDEALANLNRAVELNPDAYSSHNNRGAVLEELGRYDEALRDYERAAEIAPHEHDARWNQAFLFLRQGILERGWDAYELRLKEEGQVSIRFPYPQWEGQSLTGKTLLIYAEQGLGDEIMFASCIPDVISLAGHCIIECEQRLAPLFQRSFPTATVIGGDRSQIGWLLDVPQIDVQVAVGSLPRVLRRSIESFPPRPGYLMPDPDKAAYWRARITQLGAGLKVGICWRSGLLTGERKKLYSDLAQWAPILHIAGVQFINLQYGDCADELQDAFTKTGVPIVNFDDIDLRNDIDGSAALTACMDLVISAATAVLELAGALGVEALCIRSFGKQWPDLGQEEFSPWHPRTRLIHQLVAGDWDSQLALAAEVLQTRVNGAPGDVYVSLPDGSEMAVPNADDVATHYVVVEHEGWFDPEYRFLVALRSFCVGADVLDIGAATGYYALPFASSGARVHAYVESGADLSLLIKSRERNQLGNRLRVAIANAATLLDEQMDQQGFADVAVVRVGPGWGGAALFAGGDTLFTRHSPLVMLNVAADEGFELGGARWLLERGYALYRYFPGLALLAPCASTDDMDAFTLHLFACKPERAAQLEQLGLLIGAPVTLDTLPGIERPYWHQYLRLQPYAAQHVDGWISSNGKDPDWEVYWMALNLFALAQASDVGASTRLACLQEAERVLTTLLQSYPNLPRLVSLARILADLGKRESAVVLLGQICELVEAGMDVSLDEPLLALSDECALQGDCGRNGAWVVGMVLAKRESWRAFSSWVTGKESLAPLREARALGYRNDRLDLHIALIEARFPESA